MPAQSTLDAVRSYTRARKARLLGTADHFLAVLRNERIVATASSPDIAPLLNIAEDLGAGCGADALALVTEGVFPLVPENPLTGTSWLRGEAESVWLHHDGADRGWVTEAVITVIGDRGGASTGECWPFHLAGELVKWAETALPFDSQPLGDILATRLKRTILDPTRVPDPGDGFTGDAENGPFLTPERGRISLDIGCALMLGRRLEGGQLNLVAPSEEESATLISAGLPSWQVEVWT